MIYNLTNLNFANYGTVVDDDAPAEAGTLLEMTQTVLIQKHLFYYAKQPVFLAAEFEAGTALLRVRRHFEADAPRTFYLERSVRVDPDILFQVVPFDGTCKIKLRTTPETVLLSTTVPEQDAENKMESQIQLREILNLFYQEKEKGFRFKGEVQNEYELIYTDCGCLHSLVNGRDYCLRQGELMLYGPKQWRMIYVDDDCRAGFLTVTFRWDCPFARLLLNRVIPIGTTQSQLLKEIMREQASSTFLSEELILCFLKQFLLVLIRQVHTGTAEPKIDRQLTVNNESQIIDNAIGFLLQHVYEKVSVSDIALEANVSVSYLTSLFQKHLSASPGEYIRRKKLEESRRLIREGKLNFTEISEKLSYTSVHHFSNQFKAYYGMTPTQYSRSIY